MNVRIRETGQVAELMSKFIEHGPENVTFVRLLMPKDDNHPDRWMFVIAESLTEPTTEQPAY